MPKSGKKNIINKHQLPDFENLDFGISDFKDVSESPSSDTNELDELSTGGIYIDSYDEITVTEGNKDREAIRFGRKCQREDHINLNRRIYPKTGWDEFFDSQKFKERIENNLMLGMMGHPADGRLKWENISHYTSNLSRGDDKWILGEHITTPTPSGRILENLFRIGVKPGISSRSTGVSQMKRVKNMDVEYLSKFDIKGFDIVLEPSVVGSVARTLSDSLQSSSNANYEYAEQIVEDVSKYFDENDTLKLICENIKPTFISYQMDRGDIVENPKKENSMNTELEKKLDGFISSVSSVLKDRNEDKEDKRVITLEGDLTDAMAENDELNSRFLKAEKLYDKMRNEIEGLRDENESLESQNVEVNNELHSAKELLEAALEKVHELETKIVAHEFCVGDVNLLNSLLTCENEDSVVSMYDQLTSNKGEVRYSRKGQNVDVEGSDDEFILTDTQEDYQTNSNPFLDSNQMEVFGSLGRSMHGNINNKEATN